LEYCLPLVAFSDMDIIISPVHIELGEAPCTLELTDQVINEWWGVSILSCDGIEGSIVLDEAELTILLIDEED
jgi:hypothetical protein